MEQFGQLLVPWHGQTLLISFSYINLSWGVIIFHFAMEAVHINSIANYILTVHVENATPRCRC